jgi:hypothetical protein
MDWTLILTAIGTVATVISTVIAIRAKNEAQDILKQIKEEHSLNVGLGSFKPKIIFFNSSQKSCSE